MFRFLRLARPVPAHRNRVGLFEPGLFLSLAAVLFLAASAGAHAQFGAPPARNPGPRPLRPPSARRRPRGHRRVCRHGVPRLRPRQPSPQRGRGQIPHSLGAPRLPAALPLLELQRRRQRPLVRHQKQGPGRRVPRSGLRQPGLHRQPRPPPPVHAEVRRQTTASPCPSPSTRKASSPPTVKADYALGQRIGIEHTPTIWVVTANSKGAPFVEVVDRSKLYQLIDQAIADTTPAKAPVKNHAK